MTSAGRRTSIEIISTGDAAVGAARSTVAVSVGLSWILACRTPSSNPAKFCSADVAAGITGALFNVDLNGKTYVPCARGSNSGG